jgi:hypothetical protein
MKAPQDAITQLDKALPGINSMKAPQDFHDSMEISMNS